MRIRTTDFSLKHTLESGQFFRYRKIEDYYYVVAADKFFKLGQTDDVLELEGVNKKFVKNLFGLEQDFEKVRKEIAKDKILETAITACAGLRIMKQTPWEALAAFICSSASNIPKITMNVNLLAETFGEKICFENETAYLFPELGQMNDLQKIKNCRAGFRAKYLFEANKISAGFFDELSRMDYGSALQGLTKLSGVGEKIADCTLLFGFNRFEAFPVDVWIKRIIEQHYFQGREKSKKEIKQFGQQYFGSYAGYANQYLYYWGRNKTNKC